MHPDLLKTVTKFFKEIEGVTSLYLTHVDKRHKNLMAIYKGNPHKIVLHVSKYPSNIDKPVRVQGEIFKGDISVVQFQEVPLSSEEALVRYLTDISHTMTIMFAQ
jgi:hypothetical protein